MNLVITPLQSSKQALRRFAAGAHHGPSRGVQPSSTPLSPQTPSIPVPEPANAATREKQIPFRRTDADWEADQRETLYVSRNGGPATAQIQWHDRNSGSDVLPGLFLQAAVSRPLSGRWSLNAFGRSDFIGHITVDAGRSSDLSGWSLGGGIE